MMGLRHGPFKAREFWNDSPERIIEVRTVEYPAG
jgi:hypothetical protein